jgi:hypothetical protein
VVLGQRRFPFRHFDSGDTQTPNIRLRVVPGLSDNLWGHPERGPNECVPQSRRELGGDTEIGELDFSRSGEKNVGGFDITVDGALVVEVVETEEEFAADDGDVGFRKDTSFEEIETRTALEELHDDPQLVVDHERSIVPRYVFRVALGEVGDLLLYFGDIVVRVLEIYNGVRPHVRTATIASKSSPICLTATICLVSLWIALYTVPKLPVPSFSKSVYWLAGLLLGIGDGPDGRSFFSGLGVSEDDFCWNEPESL